MRRMYACYMRRIHACHMYLHDGVEECVQLAVRYMHVICGGGCMHVIGMCPAAVHLDLAAGSQGSESERGGGDGEWRRKEREKERKGARPVEGIEVMIE
jgi:hypothetical protein